MFAHQIIKKIEDVKKSEVDFQKNMKSLRKAKPNVYLTLLSPEFAFTEKELAKSVDEESEKLINEIAVIMLDLYIKAKKLFEAHQTSEMNNSTTNDSGNNDGSKEKSKSQKIIDFKKTIADLNVIYNDKRIQDIIKKITDKIQQQFLQLESLMPDNNQQNEQLVSLEENDNAFPFFRSFP